MVSVLGATLDASRPSIVLLIVILLSGLAASTVSAAPAMRVHRDRSRITVDTGAISLALEAAPDGGLLLHSLRNARSGLEWATPRGAAGGNVACEGFSAIGLGPGLGFRHSGHAVRRVSRGGTELRFGLEHAASGLTVSVLVTAYPGSPVVDLRLRLRNRGAAPIRQVSRFDPLSILLPAPASAFRAHWVTRNAYALHHAAVGRSLTVDGGNWNGPDAAGWLALEDVGLSEFLVAGIEWERHWAFDLREEGDRRAVRLSAGLRRGCTLDLAPGAEIESPRVFLGVATADLDDAANTTRDYLQAYVFPASLPGSPFVCYDIWSTEQDGVEDRLIEEARFSAKTLGVEVLYHDAAWYRGSDVTNRERWGVGLGSYEEDRRKLPSGLRHLADVVHGLGMRFGLWACPEMVDETVMAREGIPDTWTTEAGGRPNVQAIPGWNPMRMLCLGCPEVERHLRRRLLRSVERYRLDWLKWDASGLPGLDIVCDRADHGHQPGDGSRQAVLAKYRILDAIRRRHPNVILEQCSYGTRLDYGMARHGARVNWLSDSTAPSSHVRDNVMAAAYVFPSDRNMTWIMRDDEIGRPQTPAFLDTVFRSRMMGAFGFGTLHGSLDERVSLYPPEAVAAAVRNVAAYKTYRHLLSQRCYHLATPSDADGWQALQFAARDGNEAVLFAFRNGSPAAMRRFRLRGLDPTVRYKVRRLNTGATVEMLGAELMGEGAAVALTAEPQQSEVLVVTRRSQR